MGAPNIASGTSYPASARNWATRFARTATDASSDSKSPSSATDGTTKTGTSAGSSTDGKTTGSTSTGDSKTGDSKIASQGVASFYSDEQETASGEKFNAHELTAAHPTLPFGTKLRVTDVKTGRSVTVRVNDRGPYVPGRIVDVSYSAAQSLGMIGKGVANVRLDVVQ